MTKYLTAKKKLENLAEALVQSIMETPAIDLAWEIAGEHGYTLVPLPLKANAPNFAAQTGEPKTQKDRSYWMETQHHLMKKRRITWCRFTLDEERGIMLAEGWVTRPKVEPPAAFFLTPAKS